MVGTMAVSAVFNCKSSAVIASTVVSVVLIAVGSAGKTCTRDGSLVTILLGKF